MQLEYKKKLAKDLANVKEGESAETAQESSDYFDKIFGAAKKKKAK
jgi:hypothetical protein